MARNSKVRSMMATTPSFRRLMLRIAKAESRRIRLRVYMRDVVEHAVIAHYRRRYPRIIAEGQ